MKIMFASENDIDVIYQMILNLAEYEKMLDHVVATKEDLFQALFMKKNAEVILGEVDGVIIGFALFFHNFSTFVGRSGLYLEDLFVLPEYRGNSYGKNLLLELTRIALDRNCGRMEWAVLDWNQSAIDFYKSLGAIAMDEWTVYRLTHKQMLCLNSEKISALK